MKNPRYKKSSGIKCLLAAIIASGFFFTQSASATIELPSFKSSLTVVKEGEAPGSFFIAPLLNHPHYYETFVLNPDDPINFRVFDIPFIFYIGEKMTEVVDVTITASGDLLGGLEIINLFGHEYAGYAGVCKGDCTVTFTNAEIPLPAAVWLLGSGLFCLAGITRRSRSGRI